MLMEQRASLEELAIAEALVNARLLGQSLARFPGSIPDNASAAYRCEDAAIHKVPFPIGGWKMSGVISEAHQRAFSDERLIGPVFESRILFQGSANCVACPIIAGGFSAFEPEIIVRVKADAPVSKLDWTIEEAADMVDELFFGMEVMSSPIEGIASLGLGALAADFAAGFGLLIGDRIADWQTRDEVSAEVYREDRLIRAGKISLEKDVIPALAFLLRRAARRNHPLRAGMMIATGTLAGAHKVVAGESVRGVFPGLGEVNGRAVAARVTASNGEVGRTGEVSLPTDISSCIEVGADPGSPAPRRSSSPLR